MHAKSVSYMEPMLPQAEDRQLEDLAVELIASASQLTTLLDPQIQANIGTLVRSMNCYYSNLIEGHHTHPRDIEKALAGDYSLKKEVRCLQLEAKAHIEVQAQIDLEEAQLEVTDPEYLKWLHREFYERLPEELRWVEDPKTGSKILVEGGILRTGSVQVGRHIPPAATELPAFLERFKQAYESKYSSKVRQVIAVAASHHRLLWIHPFFDGNGRVTRLFTHAFLKQIGVGSSLWSVSRGLARQVKDYKMLLMQADEFRKGDLDGRGNLSLSGLREFCIFFLNTCLDQIHFMRSLLEPKLLLNRLEQYTEIEIAQGRLPKKSHLVLREVLLCGAIERGKVTSITGYQERQARTIITSLLKRGLLTSPTPKGELSLGFPTEVLEAWFPRLYPDLK